MLLNLTENFQKNTYFSFLFAMIPLSFILGNLILNLNIFILILSAIIFFDKNIFQIKFFLLDKVLIFLFFFSILTAVYNTFYTYNNFGPANDMTIFFKTLLYVRYLVLYFVLRYLIENNLINFKLFFFSCFIFSFLVSIDIIYQFIFGQDIFGFKPSVGKYAGPFGDELIAGSYIQRFSIFSFFLFSFFFNFKNKNTLKFLLSTLFVIFCSAIIISGNKIPFLLFLFTLILILFFEKKTRKYLFSFLTTSLIIFTLIYNVNSTVKSNFKFFFTQVSVVAKNFLDDKIIRNKMPSHFHEFESFYDTWLMNKYIGGGIKSFRFNCPKRKNVNKSDGERTTCNTHPHNYYLEILADLGIIGFLTTSSIFLIILYFSFVKKYLISNKSSLNRLMTPFVFLFLAEIFPIKSTGSFFTTGNSTYIFLIMAIIVSFYRARKSN